MASYRHTLSQNPSQPQFAIAVTNSAEETGDGDLAIEGEAGTRRQASIVPRGFPLRYFSMLYS